MTKERFATSRNRSVLLAFLCALAVACVLPATVTLGEQPDDNILSRASVLHDPDIPSLGNSKGDLTIVEFIDYQCPYCKKTVPQLAQLAKEDGNIRLVLKDWPIFGDVSVDAARLVLASKYQDKYLEAHTALMAATTKLTKDNIRDMLAAAGIDVAKATADLQAHQKTIDDLLARNTAQAEAFGFDGTPGFIVGTFRVPGVLEMSVFKQVIADARKEAKKHRS
jgi:protein-disulfide isomerase